MQSSLQNVRLILSATSLVIACTLGQCLSAFAANVNLAWDPKTDSGLAGYKVYYGTSSRSYGTPINVGNVTTYSVTGLNSGTYYFTVTAYYTSGSETGFSNEVSTTVTSVTPDSTPPTITLTSPGNGSSSSGTITVSANASDNVGVAGVQFMVDGVNLGSEDTSSPYSVSWNTATASNGSHTLTARARDAAGNQTTSSAITVSVSNTATVPTLSGLVAAFAFNENSGTTAADLSGNSNTASISGATWTSQGKFGNALTFDGVNNVVTVNDSSSLWLSNGMTLEVWVYPVNSLAGWKSVVRKEGDAYLLGASSLFGNAPAAGGHFTSDAYTYDVFDTSPLPVNTWTHLAATYDGSVLTLFVNGNQVSNRTVGGQIRNDPLPLRIGNSQYSGEGFPGMIDEVRIYNRALTQSEIQKDMNTPIGGTAPAGTPLPAPTNVSVK
jgi:concanavalin A-like lectin/glucanase superfamily protein/Big-like domain-containing protein